MAPKVGDTRMDLFTGIICSIAGVAGMMYEHCVVCSHDIDVLVQLRVSIRSLAGGGVLVVLLGMICRPSF